MIQNFEYLIVFTSAPGILPEQNDRYRIQPWKVNEIKTYKNCKEAVLNFLTQNKEDGSDLPKGVITGDENRIHFYEPEKKSANMLWKKRGISAEEI